MSATSGDLQLKGVGHTYRSARAEPVRALEPVDLDIEAGSSVALVGPSGCGKSTLLEIIAGLRPSSEGDVLLGGRKVVGPGRSRGVVFQQSSSLLPWRTVYGNVELGLLTAGVAKDEREERVASELKRVGLSDFADRPVYELSGGMQQRVQIARALAADPDVLLLDEPFGALDAFTREHLQEQLREIWKATGKTIVLVTHSVEEAVLLSTRVILLSPRPGRVIADDRLDFAQRSEPAVALRADPAFVSYASRLRAAIGQQQQPEEILV
jgi:taurine transport system ATP-binding protein